MWPPPMGTMSHCTFRDTELEDLEQGLSRATESCQ